MKMLGKNYISILIYTVASFFVVLYASAKEGDMTAEEIMLKVDTRELGRTQESTSTLTLIDDHNRQRVRDFKIYRLETEEVKKSIIFFLSPSDIKGTSYLTFDWKVKTKENDSWLFLPALKKVKRVAASDESGSFMGSDFSYSDINGVDYEDYIYTMINESEIVQGKDCWVILATPKDDSVIKKTGSTSSKNWIRKDGFILVQSIIDIKKGNRKKYYSTNTINKIDGILTVQSMQMVTTKNKIKEHTSVIKIDSVRYNHLIDENLFDVQAMQRGL